MSMFGNLGGANPPAASTLFGGAAAAPPAPATGPSLFNLGGFGGASSAGAGGQPPQQPQQQPQQPQQQQQQPQQPQQPQPQPGPPAAAHFDHLLERGRRRNAGDGLTSFDDLPALQLGLGDIARKVRNLGAGGATSLEQERAAHYLLSASGVKLGSTLRDLNQLSTQAGITTVAAANLLDTDVDGYLSNLHSQSTLALIQEGLEQSKRDFDSFLEENVQIEWDQQRKRIYEHFGLGRQEEMAAASQSTFGNTAARGAFGRSKRMGRSMGPRGAAASTTGASFGASIAAPVLGPPADFNDKPGVAGQAAPPTRFDREKQERFAKRVKDLNESRLEEKSYSILDEFSAAEIESGDQNQEHFVNAYSALRSITGERPAGQSGGPKERSFAARYLNEDPNSGDSVSIRNQILKGSRDFLETKFYNDALATVDRFAADARPGGVPSPLNKIRGYIQISVNRKELGDTEQLQRIGAEGDEFPWVIVFYLLRGGQINEASEYVRLKKNFFQNNDRIFAAAITHYAQDSERRLNQDLQQKINHVYAQRSRISPTNDPFRMACYKVVGRCELSRRNLENLPAQKIDDWVWLQFSLAREGNRAQENAGDTFGLEELRASIEEIGKRHFTSAQDVEAAGGWGVYFYLAILAGMFESAVHYLYPYAHISAVHFAIALDYYGLLRVSDWRNVGTDLLTFTTRQQAELNFGRMVGVYTGPFRTAKADDAAEYLILICLNADLPGEMGTLQANLCHEALRELVLETREFSTLLGDVKSNGHATPGIIQLRLPLIKLADQNALVKHITNEAAQHADDNGRTNDAVLLCHLAGNYDQVVTILNRALAEALSVDLGQEPLRLEPLKQRLPTAEVPTLEPVSSSVSMLGTDDPIELAQRVITLYNNNPLWWRNVGNKTRESLGILYRLNDVKKTLEMNRYMEALDDIQSLNLLPLHANGNLSIIRNTANSFSSFVPEIARNIGNVLLWSIMCCSRHRDVLLGGQFEDPTRRALADKLLLKAKDLMVYAGLIRYKLPPRVFETLAKEGQEVGVY